MIISNYENDNISEINNMELMKFSYDKIASKLSSIVSKNKKVRVVVFCSCKDHSRDRANLSFLKQFGVVPDEFDISNGDQVINILSGLNGFDGLTIFIESVPIDELLFQDTAVQNECYVSMSKISAKNRRLISGGTEKIGNYLKKNQHEYTGGYVYISGFSLSIPSAAQDSLPEAEFLPWCLEVDNKLSMSRMVRQPELSLLMQEMAEVEPLIHNLDDYLAEMNKCESELGD